MHKGKEEEGKKRGRKGVKDGNKQDDPNVLTRTFKVAQMRRPASRLKRQPQLSGSPAEGTGCKQATGEFFLGTTVILFLLAGARKSVR